MTKYPIGLQNFQGLREDGYVYVDKTAGEFASKDLVPYTRQSLKD